MSKWDKLRRKLRNNSRNIKFSELETLLVNFGFALIRVTGSHPIYRYSRQTETAKLVIPVHGNAVKPEYVTAVIEALDALFPEVEAGEKDDA